MRDIDLWKQLCAGDKNAMKKIYDNYAKVILQYGYKICKDRPVVEDALQEIFIHCWEKRKTLPEVFHIKSYMFTAIRRKIYRKMNYRPEWKSLEENDSGFFDPGFNINNRFFHNTEGDKKLIDKVRKTITQLSTRQKEIVYLMYFEGMDYEEIEQIMGIKYQSSRNLLSKALKNLRDLSVLVLFISFFQ
ncbi:RNA polymerase sigma factor [Membranihabitans maritimus]|uniref:RNA polymerase sigma factor n=1 Tax=Membranihabitans maritimus TaxID=2904244 RepID=UPI001F18DC3A|nr:sigma-70 family RNA polymerase sigma factor [Membranihabitans maritimus]